MNVLSLFDGISCGQVALQRAGINVRNYYASEIDKYAISITQKNFPNTIQLGDVTKWQDWDIDFSSIDLVLAGFPCQSWSLAGKQKGDRDKRGALFWDMLDILSKVRDGCYVLLENVKMKRDFMDYITANISKVVKGLNLYLVNSALVSAQNRPRFYWTNIFMWQQPKDKGILLKDVLEDNVEIELHPYESKFLASTDIQKESKPKIGKSVPSSVAKNIFNNHLEIFTSEKAIFNMECESGWNDNIIGLKKTPTLRAGGSGTYILDNFNIYRRVTPIECERLQTLPDNYTAEGIDSNGYVCKISNAQRYKCIGNGWTVDVISHIVKEIKN